MHAAHRPPLRGRAVRQVDGGPAHVALVAATVDVDAIRRRRPKVWLDAATAPAAAWPGRCSSTSAARS